MSRSKSAMHSKRRARTSTRNSARRSPRRTNGSPKGQSTKMAAAIVAPIFVLGAGGYGVFALLDGEELDANYCYAREDQHQAVVFVDNSIEGESEAQIRDYRTGMMRVWDNAPANSLIRIASTDRTSGGSFAPPQFTICKPAETQAEQEALGAPSQTAPMLARISGEAKGRYEEMVEQVIADATDGEKTALDSPILEQLQAISRYDGFDGPNRSITAITDGINNSETARFCVVQGALAPFERFKTTRSYSYVEPRSFEGVDVTIMLVELGGLPAPIAPYCTNAELRDFWPDYFKGNGAASVDLRRLRY